VTGHYGNGIKVLVCRHTKITSGKSQGRVQQPSDGSCELATARTQSTKAVECTELAEKCVCVCGGGGNPTPMMGSVRVKEIDTINLKLRLKIKLRIT
jgi:hypothetical protein